MTREEIQQKLWPTDTFVDFEHSINTAVNKLREALGDDVQNPRFIETLPRYGYRLIAAVEIVNANGIEVNGTRANGASPGAHSDVEILPAPPTHEISRETSPQKRWPVTAIVSALVALLIVASVALFFIFLWHRAPAPSRNAWVQITNFSDSAVSPALSPDGHMIAFIRGPETLVTPGQIYVRMLPDGEPVQLTHDDLPKMAPAFSPDGSRIAYTTTDRSMGWNTWVVPVLGGEPRQLPPNAAALSWADRQQVVFSELMPGDNMSVATATESRAGEREVYLPVKWGMANRSSVSPDGKWILVSSEMSDVGWRCRVLPFDGSTRGETAGP